MANPPLSTPSPFGGPIPSPSIAGAGDQASKDRKMASAEQLVLDLCDPELRENALTELSKKRDIFQDLAPLLWNSYGTIAALLQEIVSIYPALAPPIMSPVASNRVCNALALLQCVASHPDTRILFLNAHIPLYLYPFLNTTSKTRPFEYLRLTSLGVIGALVKVDDTEVISFLLQTEIIPLCLRTMENGSELSKTVATFIVQKILLDDVGLRYICATPERFFAVGTVLQNMILSLTEQPSSRLLKHIIHVDVGAVAVLIELLMNEHEKRPTEMLLAVLDQLCRCPEGRMELVQHAAGVAVVSKKILRVSEVASKRAVRILHSVSQTPAVLQEMLQVGAVSKLGVLLQVECRRKTRDKVKEMLRMHSRVWRNSPCLSSQLKSWYLSQ